MSDSVARAIHIAILLALTLERSGAQAPVSTGTALLRIETSVVLIPVSVTDTNGRFVAGLHFDDFELRDNGQLQHISSLVTEEGPISLCIVFDVSKSMTKPMPHAREAVRKLLAHSSPDDEFSLVVFRDKPSVALRWTTDAKAILEITDSVEPAGSTALYDALILALNEFRRAGHGRRAIVVISDGAENGSRYTFGEVVNIVRETDVAIYPIHLPDGSSEAYDTEAALTIVATESGGRYMRARKAKDFATIADSLEVRQFYVLAYRPRKTRWDGKYRKVSVKLLSAVRERPTRLSWRHGYFTPAR